MKIRLVVVFVLAAALIAFGQGRGRGSGSMGGGMGRGDMGGMGQGVGRDSGMGHDGTGRDGDHDAMGDKHGRGVDHDDAAPRAGAWKMLERKTGMTEAQLQSMFKDSGAKNFGQFASAMVVSKNLNLDSSKVLADMKSGKSLGQSLQDLGVKKDEAKAQIKKAKKEVESESDAS